MNEKKEELKRLKKACNKEKRRHVTLWKSLGIIMLVLCLILSAVSVVFTVFDNTVAAFMGLTFWEVENEDPNANYFELDFASDEEMYAYGDDICYQVEAEGAALLMNNGALPLAAGAKVSTLSSSSVNLVYGGTGSGNVDVSKADNLKVALEKSGFEVNPQLWDFYSVGEGKNYNRDASAGESAVLAGQSNIAEVPMELYPDEVKNSVASYGDAVIVTLSRVGGEGYDLEFKSMNYLAIDDNEKAMLQWAANQKKAGNVSKIIVLINTSNALQVDFLKENTYDIDACLWIGGVGVKGINAVADILAGKVNPSGSLVDTYCYDNYSSPAMQNFVPTVYAGDVEQIPSSARTYMIYQEGIYVGYKYYETRYEDYVMGTGNAGSYVYSDDVAYPFGFGLSYTTFAYSDMKVDFNEGDDQFAVTVTVTNNGTVAGKETVQVYSQSPYTQYDMDNGVEKASVALCGFGKTGILEPGASETITILVDKRDLASYDTYGAGTYILDAGEYYLTVGTDAHDAVNNTLAAKGYTVENTEGRMDKNGNAALSYKWVQDSFDSETYSTSLNGTKIENQLSSADINLYEGVEEQVTYVTRKDWTGTMPEEILQLTLTQQLIADLQDVLYKAEDYPQAEMPVLEAKNGLSLYDMMGLAYDDPKWEQLLDQLTFDEMVSMIGDSFHWRMPVGSVNAPGARDENGPQGLTAALFGAGLGDIHPTAFTSEDVMAATFNTQLMYEVGKVIGNNCLAADVVCLYGPGANIHRTPYSGRNFEYYSEDGFLSGEMCGAEVKGIQDKGVDVVLKHFALNDCEQDRLGQAAWVGEQAAREVYLKAFQKALEESGGNGVMTAYTRWGAIWSGGHRGLMTNIMRNEWGNQGMSITDNILVNYCNGADAVMAGGVTTCDAMLWYVTQQLPNYENDAVIVNAMREACHHNLYALANSSAMNGIGADTVIIPKEPALFGTVRTLAVITGILFVAAVVLWVLGTRKWKKSEAYLDYQTFRRALKDEKK
ncbi:MAG: glycoside hydrolase family 3 C-terminal domain-containing protein [Oscillospiraceae bacterium]|nr:glycoside hydrolase family 3 C-terminal domain-containing protein [Oscillospiraceae bacterium]